MPKGDFDTRRKYQKLPRVPNVSDTSIDANALTIPRALKPLGYVSAPIGKWHMSRDPTEMGYAVHTGDTDNKPGNTITKLKRLPAVHNDPKRMFSITEKSIKFMRGQVAKKTLFTCRSHTLQTTCPMSVVRQRAKSMSAIPPFKLGIKNIIQPQIK